MLEQNQVNVLELTTENLSLYDVLHMLIVGMSDFDNPESIVIRSKKLPNYYIVPNNGTFTNSLVNFIDLVKLDRSKAKIKSFALTYDFVVIHKVDYEDGTYMLDTMCLTELFVVAGLNTEVKEMWSFEEKHFYVESYEKADDKQQQL